MSALADNAAASGVLARAEAVSRALSDAAATSDTLARSAEVASRGMADGAAASDAMTAAFYLGLLSWTADDSQQFNVDIWLSGSLTVGVGVAPPPPIYGS